MIKRGKRVLMWSDGAKNWEGGGGHGDLKSESIQLQKQVRSAGGRAGLSGGGGLPAPGAARLGVPVPNHR